jgi:hypothetical protein
MKRKQASTTISFVAALYSNSLICCTVWCDVHYCNCVVEIVFFEISYHSYV